MNELDFVKILDFMKEHKLDQFEDIKRFLENNEKTRLRIKKENQANENRSLIHPYNLYEVLYKFLNITSNNPYYDSILALEKMAGVHFHHLKEMNIFKNALNKYPKFLLDLQHIIACTAPVFHFYAIDITANDFRIEFASFFLMKTDLKMRFQSLHPDNYLKTYHKFITHTLDKEENKILSEIPDSLSPAELVDEFTKKLAVSPDSYVIKKLLVQAKICHEFSTMGINFPFRDIWRFVIDGARESEGAYTFENEPGYIVGTLEALLCAIQKRKQDKNIKWYIDLHDACIQEVYSSVGLLHDIFQQTREENLSFLFYGTYNSEFGKFKIKKGIREAETNYGVSNLDQDQQGISDIFSERRADWANKNLNFRYLEFPTKTLEQLSEKLDLLFLKYQFLLEKSQDKAEKLISHLWLCRELEVHHFFEDANGRASLLAAISMVLGDDLPCMLFYDPNVFDANGPEKLCQHALSAMERFEEFCGRGEKSKKNSEIESLRPLLHVKFQFIKSWEGIIEKISQIPDFHFSSSVSTTITFSRISRFINNSIRPLGAHPQIYLAAPTQMNEENFSNLENKENNTKTSENCLLQ